MSRWRATFKIAPAASRRSRICSRPTVTRSPLPKAGPTCKRTLTTPSGRCRPTGRCGKSRPAGSVRTKRPGRSRLWPPAAKREFSAWPRTAAWRPLSTARTTVWSATISRLRFGLPTVSAENWKSSIWIFPQSWRRFSPEKATWPPAESPSRKSAPGRFCSAFPTIREASPSWSPRRRLCRKRPRRAGRDSGGALRQVLNGRS